MLTYAYRSIFTALVAQRVQNCGYTNMLSQLTTNSAISKPEYCEPGHPRFSTFVLAVLRLTRCVDTTEFVVFLFREGGNATRQNNSYRKWCYLCIFKRR